MRRVPAAGAAALALLAVRADAQARADTAGAGPRVVLRDAGPGVPGHLLAEVLSRPHVVVVAPDTGIVLGRATDAPAALVVVGGPTRLEGRVRGDLVVLGDLVLRPGAVIDGRAITLGGDIANSAFATVVGARLVFHDAGFRPTETAPGVIALDHQALDWQPVPLLSLPGVVGVRIPTYDRVNGVTVAFGPEIALAGGRARVEPTLAYRSQLGVVDPRVDVRWEATRRTTVEVRVARGTFSNDEWIRNVLVNSATSLFAGSDARNHFRADRGEATISRTIEGARGTVTPLVGARLERAWSVARDSLAASVPWSAFNARDSLDGMRRANPAVTGGTIASALAGVDARRLVGPVTARALVTVEVPVATPRGGRFVQLTGDGRVGFPTFADHTFEALAHVVLTASDSTPTQRFAYLGGGSTLPTLRLLDQGGDRLVWLEGRYTIPMTGMRLPLVGSPRVTLRHAVGGAGVRGLPALTQNVGIRIGVAGLRVDFVVDPADPRRNELGFGVGFR